MHAREPHAGTLESVGFVNERGFVWYLQNDRKRALGKTSRAALSCGVNKLGSLQASREICSHDTKVRQRVCVGGDRVGVMVGRTCFGRCIRFADLSTGIADDSPTES